MTQIYDPIHGFITLTPTMLSIVDTPLFQRLRDLKQLGAAYMVFPSATHTRFEHSIGVSYLAGKMMAALRHNQKELDITDRMVELVRIAALVHDLGHGPYSHLYDQYIRKDNEPEHEERGCTLFKKLVLKNSIDLATEEVDMILKMIVPSEEDGWLFQIVANMRNQIDVDKIDYIMRDCYHLGFQTGGEFTRIITECRVIDDTICFPEKILYDIFALFASRYRLHKQVYHHHAVISYEFMIIEVLKKTKRPFEEMTDSVCYCMTEQMARRQHWRLGAERRLTGHVTHEGFEIARKKARGCWRIHKHTIGFVSGDKSNPLDNIWFYKDNQKFKLNFKDYSFIVPDHHQETICRIYVQNPQDKAAAAEFLGVKN